MDALGYFRKEVQERCQFVAEKHAAALGDVMGLDFKKLKPSPYAAPDKPSSTAVERAELGWQVKRKEDFHPVVLCLLESRSRTG